MSTPRTKQDVLNHYAEVYNPQLYWQMDGWISEDGIADYIINPNGERLSMTGGGSYELWRGGYALRVHIRPDVSKDDAIALLLQAVEWLERDGSPRDILASCGWSEAELEADQQAGEHAENPDEPPPDNIIAFGLPFEPPPGYEPLDKKPF